ncbi:MAG: helix-turn-helix transcriptional regulator [Peptococcaceae bacterium]|mgnify:FL=1|nr:helix-turn-helix transcriptional regulator [Peptococcaceae bacterium]
MSANTIEKEVYKQIKSKMKSLRRQNKLTQLELAKKLNITVQHYQQIETGTTPPNLKILSKLCAIFDVHPSYFFEEKSISIINKEGNILADNIDPYGLTVLQNTANLSPEAKKSIIDFIKFKQYEAQKEENNNSGS